MSKIDQQIDGYKKETGQLTANISTLNNDILTLENDKPDISSKIFKINEELIGYSNVKAEMSVLTTKQKIEVENIDIEINKLENELTNFKASEGQINQQLASLTNELKSKENIINSNNLSISEIQKQIDPLNSQIDTLENQKISLNEQFNKDLANLSKQIEQTAETESIEMDKLKVDFEAQISKLNEEIINFETQSNDLNSTVSALNNEIKSIEIETPEISNQIASLNQDLENFTEIKADLAMATAKKLGINVDENTLKSVKVIDGKVVIAIEGTDLFSVVDQGMLVDNAQDFVDPLTELSVNTKVYTAKALNRELVTPEFIQAAKSISISDKIEVIAQSTAVENVGATTEQSKAFATAKAARLSARKEWNEAVASGDKVAAQAAENAFMAAKSVEQTASLNAAAAVAAASVTSQATNAASIAAEATAAATEAAQEVSQVASAAAQEAASEVKETVQAAAKSAQEAALDALWEMESLPGSSGTHTMEVTAAIRQIQAEMNGNEFNYLGAKSYEEAMEKIRANADDPNKITREWDYEANPEGEDPNKVGKCGKASC